MVIDPSHVLYSSHLFFPPFHPSLLLFIYSKTQRFLGLVSGGSKAARMASSNTFFSPLWLRNRESKGKKQQYGPQHISIPYFKKLCCLHFNKAVNPGPIPVWGQSTPHIWQPWGHEPACLRSLETAGAVCSWPASQQCYCHPADPPECPLIGKVYEGSGEKSQEPTGKKQKTN